MIKLVYVISRRADLSAEAFNDYWLNRHAPLVAAQAGALRLRKYVQSQLIDHRANEALRSARGMPPPVDGLTEIWWDSLADMQAAYATDAGAQSGRLLAQDEAKFIDFERSAVFLTEEHLILDRTGGKDPGPQAVKIAFLLARKDGLSPAECQATWLRDHGPLAAGFAEVMHMAKYVQSHAIAPAVNERLRASRNSASPLDGVTEIWLNSLADLKRGVETEAGRAASAALIEDERRFVQMNRSRCFLTRERLIFDHSGEA